MAHRAAEGSGAFDGLHRLDAAADGLRTTLLIAIPLAG
jgi:hypothetical protein